MKSIIKMRSHEFKPVYPCLKISNDGLVVLFIEGCRGTVIHPGKRGLFPVGFLGVWRESRFDRFTGAVELSN